MGNNEHGDEILEYLHNRFRDMWQVRDYPIARYLCKQIVLTLQGMKNPTGDFTPRQRRRHAELEKIRERLFEPDIPASKPMIPSVPELPPSRGSRSLRLRTSRRRRIQ